MVSYHSLRGIKGAMRVHLTSIFKKLVVSRIILDCFALVASIKREPDFIFVTFWTVPNLPLMAFSTAKGDNFDNGSCSSKGDITMNLVDLELPYTPPPPGGFCKGIFFLNAYTKCYRMSHVSTLAVGAFRIFGVKREEIMQKSLKIGNNF